ncbi:MAG: SGNH/GDSL hydrolase family protein [Solirubrobacteraceae bacterium]
MLLVGAMLLFATVGAAVATSGSASCGQAGRSRPVPAGRSSRPLLAVVGASFSAGVGARDCYHAWPQDLARILHWRVVVSADPGAGYVDPGAGHRGPFSRLVSRLDLVRLHPKVLIIQGGHDDIGRPLAQIRHRVQSLVAAIHRQLPQTRLAILSVFGRGRRPSQAALATDRAIVTAARHADPAILLFDPLAGRWHFPRIGDHLHPTAAGHRWIAQRLAGGLLANP